MQAETVHIVPILLECSSSQSSSFHWNASSEAYRIWSCNLEGNTMWRTMWCLPGLASLYVKNSQVINEFTQRLGSLNNVAIIVMLWGGWSGVWTLLWLRFFYLCKLAPRPSQGVALITHAFLVPRIKEGLSCTSSHPLVLHTLLYGELSSCTEAWYHNT